MRNVRRDGMDHLKKLEKDHRSARTSTTSMGDELQKLTDEHIKEIDQVLHAKEQEIMQV